MKYLGIIIEVKSEDQDIVTSELAEMGITSTEIIDNCAIDELLANHNEIDEDSIDFSLLKIDKNQNLKIKVYFEDSKKGKKEVEFLKNKYKSYKIKEITVDDEDWKNSYKKHFKALRLTKTIMVKPSWEKLKNQQGIYIMELDPGMTFGTGDHETTSMCALLMEKADCNGKKVLDVGTGSGILAIAAAALGSDDVLGVDIDPVAVKIANENVERNNFRDMVKIKLGDLTKGIDYKADIVVANLMAEMVVKLTKHIKKHLNRGGIYISSGILIDKKEMVIEAIEKENLKVVEVKDKGEWSAIVAKYE